MTQHVQVDETTRSINKWGATIEHTAWRPSRLDDGRCCGRKPIHYKRALAGGEGFWCHRCAREYDLAGLQRPNNQYRFCADGYFHRDEPKGAES